MHRKRFDYLKKNIATIFVASFLFPTIANSQSLEEAVAYAFDSNPEIRAAYTRFKAKEKQVDQAESGYLPSVDLNGGYGYEYTDSPSTRRSDDGDDHEDLMRSEIGIRLSQNIFNGFLTQNEVDRTSYATTAEQWRLYATAEDLALQISKVYIDLIKAEKLVGLSEKNLAAHEEIYDQIKQRTDSGFSSTADLSQINGRLAKAHSNLIAAKNNFIDSKVTFYRVINQRPENLVIPYPDSSLLPSDQESGLQNALLHNPVIKAAANDIHSARAQHESSKSNYFPRITLELSATHSDNVNGEDGWGIDDNVGGDNNNVQAMVRFSYNIFAGGKDKAYATETAYKTNEAEELNRNVHRQVTEGFILSWNAFEQLNLQKKYIKMHVIASKDTQSDYKEQFKVGQRSLLDLLDTENELYQARRDYLDAEMDEIIAQYRILHAIGGLVKSFRVTRPQTWQGETKFAGGVEQ